MAKKLRTSAKYLGRDNLHLGGFGIGAAMNLGSRLLAGQKLNLKTLGKVAAEEAIWAVAPPPILAAYLTASLGTMAATGLYSANKALNNRKNQRGHTGPTFSYQDTNQAATMRQAAVQAIQGSKLNARNSLGNEASMMYRPWSRQ